jgi:hypothetical protein
MFASSDSSIVTLIAAAALKHHEWLETEKNQTRKPSAGGTNARPLTVCFARLVV